MCTVTDQSETGKVDVDTEVTLNVKCQVEVPTVTGQPTGQARTSIKAAGNVTVSFVDGPPIDEVACTVTSQDQVGEVAEGAHVTLDFTCPLTLDEIQSNAEELAAQDPAYPDEEFEVSGCRIVSDIEGACDVTYFESDGTVCTAHIAVTVEQATDVINSHQEAATCD